MMDSEKKKSDAPRGRSSKVVDGRWVGRDHVEPSAEEKQRREDVVFGTAAAGSLAFGEAG